MSKRHDNAVHAWYGGSSNPRAIARALTEAIDEAVIEGKGTAAAKDPACQVLLDTLCFLCGLPQPSIAMETLEWLRIEQEVINLASKQTLELFGLEVTHE